MPRVAVINPHENNFDMLRSIYIMPRYGTVAVVTALKNAGYEVRAFSEYIRGSIDWEYVYNADYVCFGLMSFCAHKGYQYARQIRNKTEVPIIFGGAHPTILPEECLHYCDYVVRNEGEATLIELLDALENGKETESMAGISYRNASGEFIHNPRRDFIVDLDVPQDVSLLEGYDKVGEMRFGKVPVRHMQVIQTSRGCPFNCRFCVAPRELGTRYRTKSIETILADIRNSLAVTKSTNFMIVDNEFTINKERTEAVLKAIINTFGNSLRISVFARIEIGKHPHLLKLMKEAGVNMLIIGVESINEETLKYFEKRQTLKDIKNYICRIHDAGLHTLGSSILGSDYDRPDDVRKCADFFIENNFYQATFYALYDFPTKHNVLGLPQIFEDNRFIHRDWRFFTGKYVIHFPKHMKPSTLQKLIIENYKKFYSLDRIKTAFQRIGYKRYLVNPEIQIAEKYIEVLESLEEGLYSKNERLIDRKLPPNGCVRDLPDRIELELDDVGTAVA